MFVAYSKIRDTVNIEFNQNELVFFFLICYYFKSKVNVSIYVPIHITEIHIL